jgi:hypothetical protein
LPKKIGGDLCGAPRFLRRKLVQKNYGALDDALLNKRLFFPNSLAHWSSFVQKCDFVIGSRLHGTIMALLSGTPAWCSGSDVRTRETLESLSMSPLVLSNRVSPNSLSYLYESAQSSTLIFRRVVEDFRILYQQIFRDFLK